MGGLSKKGFQFSKLATETSIPHLTLDAGSLLFKRSTITPGQEEQEKMTAAAIVKAYNLIGYNAVCVGSQDLVAGLPYLKALSKEAKFAWLSANLVSKKTNRPIFTPSVSLKAGRLKVGVIGLTGPALLPADSNATLLPWEPVLSKMVPKVAKEHDLVILLSNLPATENRRIAEAYSSIHLIVQSRVNAVAISSEPVNNTIIVSSGPQGKQVGAMKITWQPGGRWDDHKAGVLARKKADLDRLRLALGRYQQNENPETSLASRPNQLKTYHLLQARTKKMEEEIDQLSQAISRQGPVKGVPSTYSNRFFSMETTLPDQPQVAEVVDRLKAAINELGQRQAVSRRPPASASPYLGFRGCGSCHHRELASWQKSGHARAYRTLEQKKQQFNQNCLPCHVTGVPLSQAAEALSLPTDRRGVGCETCHGPGRLHSVNPKANPLVRKPSSVVCQACHKSPHDPVFDYGRKILMIGHQ